MKITSYQVESIAKREYVFAESIKASIVSQNRQPAPEKKQGYENNGKSVKLNLSDAANRILEQTKQNNEKTMSQIKANAQSRIKSKSDTAATPKDLKIKLLEEFYYALTGKRLKFGEVEPTMQTAQKSVEMPNIQASSVEAASQGMIAMEFEHFVYESESISYQTQAQINTADGQSITVDMSMSMSRQVASYTKIDAVFNTCDPLVINYAGNAASLTDEKYAFDLTMDGKAESISFAGEGSGFLGLDQNHDGKINDGSELFGPSSGSGFAELRAYDQDKNGWIDENDAVFDKLVVWSKDKNGNDQLYKLKELDVGAVFLGDVSTNFSLTNDQNSTQGVMRSTSFFLKENGGAGTISHIDLTL